MRVLVTGGAGFIGSHLCERLVNDGHSVVALDNLSTGLSSNLSSLKEVNRFNLIEGSILDNQVLKPLIGEVDYVFHLAAAVGVFNIVNHPLDSLLTNIHLHKRKNPKIPVSHCNRRHLKSKNESNILQNPNKRAKKPCQKTKIRRSLPSTETYSSNKKR